MKKISKKLLSSLSLLTIPSVAVISAKCGNDVETTERLNQQKDLKENKRVAELEEIWNNFALSYIYNLKPAKQHDANSWKKNFEKEFQNQNSQLFKDSYEAYKIFALDQLSKNEYYFVEKSLEWKKNDVFKTNPFDWISTKNFPGETNPADFIKIWMEDKTGIRKEINNMLLVKAYFEISDLSKLQTIANNIANVGKKDKEKSKDQKFEYYVDGKDAKFDLKYYNLVKYAFENKYIQLWNRTFDDKTTSNDIFTRKEIKNTISNKEDFNAFFKDSAEAEKKAKEWEIITTNTEDKELQGYAGIQKDPGTYGLNWDETDNKRRNRGSGTYGVYDALNSILFSFSDLSSKNSSVNVKDKDGKSIVSYINQIVPVGKKVKLRTKEDYIKKSVEDSKLKEVEVLSFEDSIYKGNLNKLAYLFYGKDAKNLLEKAIEAFAHLGVKIKVNKEITPLYEQLKDKVWVEK
ncbi:hypothetical protein J7894_02205 [Mycoplasmopsis agalactiae]|nr:hypothetical protein [Mycoplasmopsis agalactiae]MCE6090861.1 hypothetical protein [Mycoplasmopsis agalactiae]